MHVDLDSPRSAGRPATRESRLVHHHDPGNTHPFEIELAEMKRPL